MHALIVVAHPVRGSLTQAVARRIAEGIEAKEAGHTAEIADLAAEGFDPRFTAVDVAVQLREAEPTADVVAQQKRVERADALVLVYPVYWWSFPALLKGWIDRVFTNGWAYDDSEPGRLVKMLGHLPVHLVGLGASDPGTYRRHGYEAAMRTQIDHGIFDFCGAPVLGSTFLFDTYTTGAAHLDGAREIGAGLFDRARTAAAA